MRALGPEPDVEKLHLQVQRQIQVALRDHKRDVRELRVSFSNEGYTRARYQTVPGMDPWGPRSQPTHYLGLPFVVDRRQTVDVLVQLSDGQPIERRNK